MLIIIDLNSIYTSDILSGPISAGDVEELVQADNEYKESINGKNAIIKCFVLLIFITPNGRAYPPQYLII